MTTRRKHQELNKSRSFMRSFISDEFYVLLTRANFEKLLWFFGPWPCFGV